ncbi:hypothetical protein AAJ76_1220007169 [Vairimorpha ceranae]|uniref:Uncharacterized protein n=1 Tax=Vairimorpha ceranae TaxID=40302 RepID=A0A0F9W8P4_9MICR|nr:hypothetical protein AAJ76_1220007169 [Vairimorpha ceranae]KKO74081.1 hypothetical protein AAJ76_1220007169 [Vairimorpha ceranae]
MMFLFFKKLKSMLHIKKNLFFKIFLNLFFVKNNPRALYIVN